MAAFQSTYTYAMDCCLTVQANITVEASSQCNKLFDILTKGIMVSCSSSENARIYINAGDTVLNVSSNYSPRSDMQCTATGSGTYNASLQGPLVINFRNGVFDQNVPLVQASVIGICDVLYAGFTSFKRW